MPNRINQAMVAEYSEKFGEAPDCVAVDYQSLSVEEISEFRRLANDKEIHVFVVKNSIARRVLSEQLEDSNGLGDVLVGQTALLFGGEGMPDLARLVAGYQKKTGKLAVRGGLFEKQVVASTR